MSSTVNKGLETQSTGSNSGTWGTILNDNMISYVDTMLGGSVATSLSSSNVLLTQAQARNAMLRFTGTLTASVQVSPDTGVLMTGFYYFENLTTGSYTVTFANGGGSVVLPQSRRGVMWIDTSNGPRIMGISGSSNADPIPVGTVMLFYQNAAPTGWSISSALNDYALKIVSSSGGVTSGSVAYSTLFGRTATDGHTLTTSEIPSHTHAFTYNPTTATGTASAVVSTIQTSGGFTTVTSQATGGGGSHEHNIDMRVQTASIILATKN